MASLDELTAEIRIVGKSIEQMLRSYNKEPSENKTAAYITTQLSTLEEKFQEFEIIHQKIIKQETSNPSHPYFQTEYHDQVKSGYSKLKEALSEFQKQLDSNSTLETRQQNSDFTFDMGDTDTKLGKLINKQKSIMKMLEHLIVQIEEDVTPRSKHYCELQIEKLNIFWEKMINTNLEIWQYCDADSPANYSLAEYTKLDSKINTVLIDLMQVLDQFVKPTIENTKASMKLPKISVPTFDGDYLKWHQFHDIFNQMIHQSSLSNSEKMFYLNDSLSGEARALIQHLPTTNENYIAAWQIIKSRYDNKRVIIASLLNKLLNQPNIQQDNISSIKSLHDVTVECWTGLKNAGLPVESWDVIILHLLIKKLDRSTHSLYEQQVKNPADLQSLKDFLNFLEIRFQALESLGPKMRQQQTDDKSKSNSTFKKSNTKVSSFLGTGSSTCKLDNENHFLYKCPKFIAMTVADRFKTVKSLNICFNCLRDSHSASECKAGVCKTCSKKHSSLLHYDNSKSQNQSKSNNPHQASSSKYSTNNPEKQQAKRNAAEPDATTAYSSNPLDHVFLASAMINVYDIFGQPIECRVLLDSGSQVNLITKKFSSKLGFKLKDSNVKITGIGDNKEISTKRFNVNIESKIMNYTKYIEVFVLDKVVNDQPAQDIDVSHWKIPKNIKLADPKFNECREIDMLIGAEFYNEILMVGQVSLDSTTPILQNTVFGWVVLGKLGQVENNGFQTCSVLTIDDAIQKLWEMDEIMPNEQNQIISTVNAQCEQFFENTTKRNDDGRFIVNLPFLDDTSKLGNSSITAKRRFLALEKRLDKNPDIKAKYSEFLDEYEFLGHMSEIDENYLPSRHYFIPHHCVQKLESTTTKLRVVFDASCKTSTNISLNDLMHTGPKIQSDIFDVLIRFRQHKYVFTGDIEKMYRQILINNDDANLQLIYWRKESTSNLKCYRLQTVTYGTAAAPYLAIKCLHTLANINAQTSPESARSIKQDFYVDDLMTGGNKLDATIKLRDEINKILLSAGFRLRKWCANHPDLLKGLPTDEVEVQLDISGAAENQVKTLGITWMPHIDKIAIKTNWKNQNRISKRTILSDVAHIFDPLGLVSPVVVIAKIFIQELWKLKLDWDASLPQELHTKWTVFRNQLQHLNGLTYDRQTTSFEGINKLQIHIFSDASLKAYGSVAYSRSLDDMGNVTVKLLCSKSRVAPTKVQTIPRLELQAAKLSVELGLKLFKILDLKTNSIYYWTDSQIVLDWMNSQSSIFNIFVSNRISYIQRHSQTKQWRHVDSKNNPADYISRGIFPDKMKDTKMWFEGPSFLHKNDNEWSKAYRTNTVPDLERKTKVSILNTSIEDLHFIFRINHKNSFSQLCRITAYILRATNILQKKAVPASSLMVSEVNKSIKLIVGELQNMFFQNDIKELRNNKQLSKQHKLCNLTPFLDPEGIIRVGGRLTEADLPFDAKHPMLLPGNHEFTEMIMTELHIQHHHVGPQTLLSITRQKFWPLKGKVLANRIVHHCMECFRAKPMCFNQIMGNLPPVRVQSGRPFINVGVDYAGPIWTHYKGRGSRTQKTYIAVFCCLATKALHIEVVSDLSADGFIGALRRFWSRRGNCNKLFLDNATNFKGAQSQLRELHELLDCKKFRDKLNHVGIERGIDFCFIPPRAPHMGGIWEAAVKSIKQLMIKTIGKASLTYEELGTLLTEIEAILNSRPIAPISNNANDLSALTPAHFLIGDKMTSVVDPEVDPTKTSLVTRWKLVSTLKAQFWRRWSEEYLNSLQQRYKWKIKCQNVTPGLMVLIKEDNLPPTKWILGRILKTYPGKDDLIRVVDVKTSSGILKRPIQKLCPLPLKQENLPTTSNTQTDSQGNTDQRDEGSKDKRPKTKRTRKFQSNFATILLGLFFVTAVVSEKPTKPFQITSFDSNPGIFFENIGLTRLINNEWNLIVYYDLESYWKEFENLNLILNNINLLCNCSETFTREIMCSEVSTEFKSNIETIENSNELLRRNTISQTRAKRGAINLVGSIANKLFGVLDEDYATKISSIIKQMDTKEAKLSSMVHDQISIVETTTNIIKQTQEENDKEFQAIRTQLQEVNNQSTQQKMQYLFSSLSFKLLLKLHRYQILQNQLTDVLIDAHSGKINPLLITPDQLKDSFSSISNNLPPRIELPFNKFKEKDVINIYRLIHVTSRLVDNHLIFRLQLPLLSQDQFEMYRLIPVPMFVNETVTRIKPSSSYLTVSLYKDVFYPMTELEVSHCQRPDDEVILCKQTHPLYNKMSGMSKCEMELLNHNGITNDCNIEQPTNFQEWIQLQNPNQWIFSVRQETLVNVVCGSKGQFAQIQKMGILTVDKNCLIKLPTLTITSHNVFPTELRAPFIPSTDEHQLRVPTVSNKLEPLLKAHNQHIEELEKVKQQIHIMKNNQKEADYYQPHEIHQFTIGYLAILAAFGVSVFAIWNYLQVKRKANVKPSPAKRHTSVAAQRRSSAADFTFDENDV